jgi:hypothetical protein
MARTTPALPERAVQARGEGRPAVLVTVGADGWAHAAMTWAAALDASRVRARIEAAALCEIERRVLAELREGPVAR